MQQNDWNRLDDEVRKVIEMLRVAREKSGIPVIRSLMAQLDKGGIGGKTQ